MSILIASLIATLIPIIVLYAIYTLNIYQTSAFRLVTTAFIWGAIAAGLAYLLNNWLFLNISALDADTAVRFVIPIVEELLKAALLLYLVTRTDFSYYVDGAIYGFAIGIGFAVLENYFYLGANQDAALGVAVGRVLSGNLVHAATTAVVGIALGIARFGSGSQRIRSLIGGLLLAILLHIGYNSLNAPGSQASGLLLFVYSAAAGLAGFGLIMAAIRQGLFEQKGWIRDTLRQSRRITTNEIRTVGHLENIEALLEPVRETYDQETFEAAVHFLTRLAQLGIKRKLLEKLPPGTQQQQVAAEVQQLTGEIDELRRALGPYKMTYLRQLVPDQFEPLHTQLEQRLPGRPAGGGSNLFAGLDKKNTRPEAPDDDDH